MNTRKWLHSPGLTADQCLKCNICTLACPVVSATDRFPGPKTVGPQMERFRSPRIPIEDAALAWCSGCGICSRVCPHGVLVAEMNIRAKARLASQNRVPIRDHLISRPGGLGRVNVPFAPVSNAAMRTKSVRWLLEAALGISRNSPLPEFSKEPLRKREAGRCAGTPPDESARDGRVVAYFHGCSANYFEPELGGLTIDVLEALGCDVLLPPQECCGLPLQSNGIFKSAARKGRSNIDALAPFANKGIPIIGSSTSCTLELKHEYREVLELHGENVEKVAAATYDVFEFIEDELFERLVTKELQPLPRRLLYHPPCQLKNQGIGLPALQVLRRIPELEIVLSHSECCGMAGTYGVKLERYEVAREIGSGLFESASDGSIDFILCDSETCRWWIEKHTGKPCYHPLRVLAHSLGLQVLPHA
jgi:glycerol-3-phosphate dehydrogenase subunit C